MSAESTDQDRGRDRTRGSVCGAQGHAAGRSRLRKRATQPFARFERSGLPHRRVEQWKYTDLRALMREAKPLAPPPDRRCEGACEDRGQYVVGVPAHRFVFVDGAFVPELSDRGRSPASALFACVGPDARRWRWSVSGRRERRADDPALALNLAFAADGAVIHVAPDAVVAKPIHLVFIHSGTAADRRIHALARRRRAGADVTLVESHEGPDKLDYQINAALALIVGDGAKVNHVKVAPRRRQALHVATLLAAVGEGADIAPVQFHPRRRR